MIIESQKREKPSKNLISISRGARFFSSSLRLLEKSAGFTLTELLIVIAITAIISAAGFLSLGNFRGRQAVSSAVDEVSSVIRATRQRSLAQEGGGRWGIRFSNSSTSVSSYTTFRGYAYATGTIDRQYSLPSNVSFSNPFVSSTYDLVFSPLAGSVPERKVFSVVSGRGSAPVGDLVVKSNGSAVSRLESGLVGYWHLDEGTATTTYDASGKSNIGTLTNGPTWQSGSSCKAGGCLSFNGSNTSVSVPNDDAFVPSALTISVWIKPVSLSSYMQIVSKFPWSSNFSYQLNTTSDGKLRIDFSSNGSSYGSVVSAGNLTAGAWQHVATTWSGSQWKLYINGTVDQNTGSWAGPFYNTSTTVDIGRVSGSNNQVFSGSIDEVRIYNRALSAAEILNQYNDLK